jgi:raffinose/stachyose/melibiose transport system permease protein
MDGMEVQMKGTGLKAPTKDLLLFLTVPVGIYFFIAFVPVVISLYYSLFDWMGGPKMHFVGLDNYLTLIKDDYFWLSLKNTLIITVLCVIGQVGFSLVLALLFTMKWLKLKGFHRTVIFFPVVLSPVVIGILWQLIYNYDMGLLNTFLSFAGLDSWVKPWLDDPKWILLMVSIPVMWQFIGLYLLIFMGAIESIPKDILEVAEIDGADGFKRSFYITLPMIYNTFKIAVMICLAGTMKIFDHIYVMTGGGPGKSSLVMVQYAYDTSFDMLKLSYGSTIAMGLLVITLVITLASRFLMGGARYE